MTRRPGAAPVALVSGASSGIGAATARALARAGYRVVLMARGAAGLDAVAASIRAAGAEAHPYPVDLADPQAAVAACRRVRAEVGPVEVLFNNAGAGRWLSVTETEPDEALAMMAVPYLAAFVLTRELLPDMLAARRGHVLFITSPAGFFPVAGAAGYSAARWAVRGLHASLWAELVGTGVATTLVCPAKVRTPYFANNPGSEDRIPRAGLWMGQCTEEEVAAGVVAALRRRPRYLFMPWRVRLFLWLQRLAPAVTDHLSVWTGWQRARSLTAGDAALPERPDT